MGLQDAIKAAKELLPAEGKIPFEAWRNSVLAQGDEFAAGAIAHLVSSDGFAGSMIRDTDTGKLSLHVGRK